MNSPDPAFIDQPVLESAPSEAGAPLEEGIPTWGPSNVDEIGEVAPSWVDASPILQPRPTDTESSRKRPPDQVLLSMYVLHRRGSIPQRAWFPLIYRVLEISSTAGAPFTR